MKNHSSPIVNLPWYDFPELKQATDALWSAVREELGSAGLGALPTELDRELPYLDAWHSPEFLLGQACGYDLIISAQEHLQYVATPCYSAPCSLGPQYRSYVLVRDADPHQSLEDLRGLRCVINQRTSHSGMNTLRSELAPKALQGHFFSAVLESGAHRASLASLRCGQADVAAIDCVAFALLSRDAPADVEGLRIIHKTLPVPSPPYVTSSATDPQVLELLQQALTSAVARPALAATRRTLMLSSVEVLDPADYDIIQEQKNAADACGYSELLSPPKL